jgi:hypothetical protein
MMNERKTEGEWEKSKILLLLFDILTNRYSRKEYNDGDEISKLQKWIESESWLSKLDESNDEMILLLFIPTQWIQWNNQMAPEE